MPIVGNSDPDNPGSPVCGDVKTSCNTSPPGVVAGGCDDCGGSPCGCTATVAEPILSRDGCAPLGSASVAPSTACSECFRGTVPTQRGYVLVKKAPGDKCLQHLSAAEQAFMVSHPDGGSFLTKSPEVDVPIAQGYRQTVTGELLMDESGRPILGDTPEFSELWISGIEECGEKRLFKLKAPNVADPIYLVAQNGCFRFAAEEEKPLCSKILPETATVGRLLLIDKDEECEGATPWCPKELNLGLDAGACVTLTATQTEGGKTELGYVVPSSVAGFLRSNPGNPCAPVNGDTLSEEELTQLTGFLNQIVCDPDLPAAGESTLEIDRFLACGTRTFGPEVTEGVQSITRKELYDELQKEVPEDLITDPVDINGDPLVDGCRYDAVWNAAEERIDYIPAHRSRALNLDVVGTYSAGGTNNSGSTPYSINLASYGITYAKATHVELIFDLDVRYRSRASTAEAFVYVEINGNRFAETGQVNRGQTTFSSADEAQGQSQTVRLMVPIISGSIAWVMGHVYNSPEGTDNEFWARARLYALHENPLIL